MVKKTLGLLIPFVLLSSPMALAKDVQQSTVLENYSMNTLFSGHHGKIAGSEQDEDQNNESVDNQQTSTDGTQTSTDSTQTPTTDRQTSPTADDQNATAQTSDQNSTTQTDDQQHAGLINAFKHVKNKHAIDVIQAILNGQSPAAAAQNVTQLSPTSNRDDNADQQVALKAVLTALEQDHADSKQKLSSAFLKVADALIAHQDLQSGIQSVEDAVYADPTQTSTFEKLGKLYAQKGNHQIKAFVNGKQPAFDVTPYIRNNRTLVPIRAITEALGAKVDWNSQTQTVTITKDGHTVSLTIGSNQAMVDGQPQTLDAPAEMTKNRTFVPARFIAEAFGAIVQWFQTGSIVDITTSGSGTDTTGTTDTSGPFDTASTSDTSSTSDTTSTTP